MTAWSKVRAVGPALTIASSEGSSRRDASACRCTARGAPLPLSRMREYSAEQAPITVPAGLVGQICAHRACSWCSGTDHGPLLASHVSLRCLILLKRSRGKSPLAAAAASAVLVAPSARCTVAGAMAAWTGLSRDLLLVSIYLQL
jgi:hypothetical protein